MTRVKNINNEAKLIIQLFLNNCFFFIKYIGVCRVRLGKSRIGSDRNVVYRRFYAKRLEIRKIRGRIRTFFTWDFHFKDTK